MTALEVAVLVNRVAVGISGGEIQVSFPAIAAASSMAERMVYDPDFLYQTEGVGKFLISTCIPLFPIAEKAS